MIHVENLQIGIFYRFSYKTADGLTQYQIGKFLGISISCGLLWAEWEIDGDMIPFGIEEIQSAARYL